MITLPAKNAGQAYEKLCQALNTLEAEWDTDTFQETDENGDYSDDVIQSTEVLFPQDI